MKEKKTPLHFAQQLEDFQTARKAKEVNEVYKFEQLKEGLKQRQLTLNRRLEKLRQKSRRQMLEEPEIAEEQIVQQQAQALQELAGFEQQAYDTRVDAPDNEFDTIAEIQGFHYHCPEVHQELKQLPEAHSDAFAHELTALTEQELQKELELNEKALQDSLKKPGRLELSSEPLPKEPEPQPAPVEQEKHEEESEQQEDILETELEAQKKTEPEVVPEKKKSESSLIYFRSSPPPSDE